MPPPLPCVRMHQVHGQRHVMEFGQSPVATDVGPNLACQHVQVRTQLAKGDLGQRLIDDTLVV